MRSTLFRWSCVIALLVSLLSLQPVPPAYAATRYVSTTGLNTANNCTDPDQPCATLTHAIGQAVSGDSLSLAAGTYTEADIVVDKSLTITGAGADLTVIQAHADPDLATDRVFFINSVLGITVNLQMMTIRHGRIVGANIGGGILSSAHLTLDGVILTDNFAGQGGGMYHAIGNLTVLNSIISGNTSVSDGGGVYGGSHILTINNTVFSGNTGYSGAGLHFGVSGNATINGSMFQDNVATRDGGGFYMEGGSMTISDSAFINNSATLDGGGLYSHTDITVTHSVFAGNTALQNGGGMYHQGWANEPPSKLVNTTISGNRANINGGGLYLSDGEATLLYNTVTANVADDNNDNNGDGGGVYIRPPFSPGKELYLQSSLIFGNDDKSTPGQDDCSGNVTSQGYNLVGLNTGCPTDGTGDATTTDPLLGPLGYNGGFTPTHALLPGSPALDQIPNGTNGCGTTVALDQRGFARPQNSLCDIGAVEGFVLQFFLPLLLR